MAVKWYFPQNATKEQREILDELVKKGKPTESFLWPIEVVESRKGAETPGTFGYSMPIRGKQYRSIVDHMKRKVDLDFRTLCTIGANMSYSFYQLHAMGMCYRDISFGNVFFHPQTGDVLICDNDNVWYDKRLKGATVLGTQRFMAPEIVTGRSLPSGDSDRYSLAILLFYMFFISHPLEGKKELEIKCLDTPAMNRLYGERPIFIFDPDDQSNRPDPHLQRNAIDFWNIYPKFFRDMFTETFTKGIHDPENGRTRETAWYKGLVRLRDSLLYCPCGAENFYDIELVKKDQDVNCWACKNPVPVPPRMKVNRHVVMLNHDTKIFPYHLDDSVYDIRNPVAEMSQNPNSPSIWGLKNISNKSWRIYGDDDSKQTEIQSGKTVKLTNGLRIDFGTTIAEIKG
jgi:serine/threonine protein kinase